MREVGSLVARFALVMAAAAGVLGAADRVPALVTGTTHGARVYRTLEEAQASVGARLLVPSYYPDSLAWPPARIEVAPGSPPVTAIRIAARGGSRDALIICQSIGGAAPPPPWLLPPLQQLEEVRVVIGARPARLARLLTPGGRVVHDLSWAQGGRRFTLRYDGEVEDLLRMARAMERDAS
jgi:hypothetical protein